jgi:response regulator RpfG family c-di-GMP phosphodiesterase
MKDNSRTRVLFVDDEANLLEALTRSLYGSHFDVTTALGSQAGLEILRQKGPFAVVVSDLHMPGMDGVTLLRHARELAPDTVRVLFTGQPDLDNAIAAVNEGSIFRFITKPCSSQTLVNTLQAAAEQHRLITAERVLLEETLRGSIKALTDVLALANPVAFGRATRIRQSVSALLSHFGLQDGWPVEVAAMLSQIGCVTLPPRTLEKLYHGEAMSPSEQSMVDRMPIVVDQLLGHIPRLEPVRQILGYEHKRYDGSGTPRDGVSGEAMPWGARPQSGSRP